MIAPTQENPGASRNKIPAIARDLVFVDVETTGLNPHEHEIIELAAVRTSPDALLVRNSIEHLVLPVHIETAHPKALEVNGYDAERWVRDAVLLEMALYRFVNLCYGGVTLVAHNATFDWGFLRESLSRKHSGGTGIDYHIICTASLAWPLVMQGGIESPKLEKLCDHFGISNDGQHRAMRDVQRTIEVYKRLMPHNAPRDGTKCPECHGELMGLAECHNQTCSYVRT